MDLDEAGAYLVVNSGLRPDINDEIRKHLYYAAEIFDNEVGTSNGKTALFFALIFVLNEHRKQKESPDEL